jgi:hypothetical protein
MKQTIFPGDKITDSEFKQIVGETRERIEQLEKGTKYIIYDQNASKELARLSKLSTGFIRKAEDGKPTIGTGNIELDRAIFVKSLHYILYLASCQKKDTKWYDQILPVNTKKHMHVLESARELAEIEMKKYNIPKEKIERIFKLYGFSLVD